MNSLSVGMLMGIASVYVVSGLFAGQAPVPPAAQEPPHSTPGTQAASQRSGGRLDFRIAPEGRDVPRDVQAQYKQQLATDGPRSSAHSAAYAWFEIQNPSGVSGLAITGDWRGHRYMLLSNQPDKVMLMGRGEPAWAVKSALVRPNGQDASWVIDVVLDDAGAARMQDLTSSHLRQRVAILLNDEVLVAPTVMSPLSGMPISGHYTAEQAMAIAGDLRQCIRERAATQPAGRPGRPLEEAMNLWVEGEQDQAVQYFLRIQWDNLHFAEGSIFSRRESELMDMPQARWQMLAQDALEAGHVLREISKLISAQADQYAFDKQYQQAEEMLQAVRSCGRIISVPDALAIFRALGIANQKLALESLARLYEVSGPRDKIAACQAALHDLDAQLDALRKEAGQAPAKAAEWARRQAATRTAATQPTE